MSRSILLTALSTAFVAAPAYTQPPTEEPLPPVDSYRMPIPYGSVVPVYPASAQAAAREGWVRLNFMVNPEGSAYEIRVLDNVGDDAFITAARRAAEKTSFRPASVGDQAVDGSMTITYRFVMEDTERAARSAFADRYRRFIRSLDEESQDEAAERLARLEDVDIHNNYEYAYLSLARFQYASRYGTALEQMQHLETALGESVEQPEYESYLPADTVTSSRRALFQLMVQNQHFAEAVDVFRLMEIRGDEEGLTLFRQTYDALQAFRANDEPYAIAGQLDENGSWNVSLFKDEFYFDNVVGSVDEIKLRCEREYVFLEFDSETQYAVSDSAGSCRMEVLGAAGTTFALVQS